MKTKSNKNTKSGTQEQIRTVEQNKPEAQSANAQPEKKDNRDGKCTLHPIDFKRRHENRTLSTQAVLDLLQKEAPHFFELAEVVGKWVWIQFAEKQPREVTAGLAQLGFHWNNKRQVWQHPCGQPTEGTLGNPREKYPSYFPADAKAA